MVEEVPAAHAGQEAAPPVEYVPDPQLVHAVAWLVEKNCPAGQFKHAVAPVLLMYVPGAPEPNPTIMGTLQPHKQSTEGRSVARHLHNISKWVLAADYRTAYEGFPQLPLGPVPNFPRHLQR